jgi:RNA polymerase sigma factor (sigma-70 family)
LYRAADAIDPGGGSREIADALYADLYGIGNEPDDRRSLFRYFHGRSSLATWLRAVLSQRHVDRVRAARRFAPLSEVDAPPALSLRSHREETPNPERPRYLTLVREALGRSLVRLEPRDRLRVGYYYAEGLTLAQIGKLLGEHEATVSRQLGRARRVIRDEIERQLRNQGLNDAAIAECFESAMDDPGPIDLNQALAAAEAARDPGRIVPEKGENAPDGVTASPGPKGRGAGGRRA